MFSVEKFYAARKKNFPRRLAPCLKLQHKLKSPGRPGDFKT